LSAFLAGIDITGNSTGGVVVLQTCYRLNRI
jgi:hypothetical protein